MPTTHILHNILSAEERAAPMFPRSFPLHSRSPTYQELLAFPTTRVATVWPDHLTRLDAGRLLCFLTSHHRTFARALLCPSLNHGAMAQFINLTWPFDGIKHRGKQHQFTSRLRILRLHVITVASRIAIQSLVPGTYNDKSNRSHKVFDESPQWNLQSILDNIKIEEYRTDVDTWKEEDFRQLFTKFPPEKFAAKVNAYPQLNFHSVSKPPSIPHRFFFHVAFIISIPFQIPGFGSDKNL